MSTGWFMFPVVVGRGARLFESANVKLKLLETQPFVSGAVLLRYAVPGTGHDPKEASMQSPD